MDNIRTTHAVLLTHPRRPALRGAGLPGGPERSIRAEEPVRVELSLASYTLGSAWSKKEAKKTRSEISQATTAALLIILKNPAFIHSERSDKLKQKYDLELLKMSSQVSFAGPLWGTGHRGRDLCGVRNERWTF